MLPEDPPKVPTPNTASSADAPSPPKPDDIRIDGKIGTDPEELKHWADHVVAGKPIEHMEIADLRALIEAVQAHPEARLTTPWPRDTSPPQDHREHGPTCMHICGGIVRSRGHRLMDVRIAVDVNSVFTASVIFVATHFGAPASFRGSVFNAGATFADARFARDADFESVTFLDHATFMRSRFHREARFDGTRFQASVSYYAAQFEGVASFPQSSFCGHAYFNNACFFGPTRWNDARFDQDCDFIRVALHDDIDFRHAHFNAGICLALSTCHRSVLLSGVEFRGGAGFQGVIIFGDLCCDSTRFGDLTFFSSTRISGKARFEGAAFMGDAEFQQTHFGSHTSFERATFASDARFWGTEFAADARFDGATFSGNRTQFLGARFRGHASFDLARFADASFSHSTFDAGRSFANATATAGTLPTTEP